MSRLRCSSSLAAAVCVLIAATALAHPAGASSKPTTTTKPCGGVTIKKPGGGSWVCTMDDEFNGTSLNTKLWTALNTATAGFRAGQECNTPQNLRVSDGALVITATRSATVQRCGRYTTKYFSGMITSQGKFSQAYGRFEIRAKFPSGKGFQPAFWLLPENTKSTGAYEYGEIDVAEAYTYRPNIVAPHLHYVQTPGTPANGRACTVDDAESAYHTYTLQWTPTQMTFLYDGTTCWSTSWKPKLGYAPMGASAPAPFNQPFYIIVQLSVGGSKTPTNEPSPTTSFPESMDVDYIRVWK